jgi:UPF0755 protein
MTIRGGGRPREDHSQAHPQDPGSLDYTPAASPWNDANRLQYDGRRGGNGRSGWNGRGNQTGRSSIAGLLRFLVFALILAAVVLAGMLTVLRPVVSGAVAGWAYDNPGALRIPFVADMVRENLGGALTEPASSAAEEVEFTVEGGDTPPSIAQRLVDQGLLKSEQAFIFEATLQNLTPQLEEGNFSLAANMTPGQLVSGLINNQIVVTTVPVNFREGLRLEQITAKLQTLGAPLTIDAEEFYSLAKHPPAKLLADYPWLKKAGLPKGASLEGFLAPATYVLDAESTAEGLLREMLSAWYKRVGSERLAVPKARGLTFYEILTLASIVEREAVVDKERPLIAGVYQNRLTPTIWRTGLLEADPTVIYGVDTAKLGEYSTDWQQYSFWNVPEGRMKDQELTGALAGFQTYRHRGLPPGPISTPTVPSIDAALEPSTKDRYLFFLAVPDSGGKHVFAKTQAEHDANRNKYGYT